jgi:type 1 glutamine amidotransferase
VFQRRLLYAFALCMFQLRHNSSPAPSTVHPMRTLLCLLLGLSNFAAQAATPLPKILFFANPMSSDNHIVRRAQPDELSVAERHFRELSRGIFDVTITQDGAQLSRETFPRYDAIVFFTAINPPGVDIDALVEWVRGGGAFIGIHSTANTYQKHPGFGELLGARYDRRPWRTAKAPQTKVRVKVNDRTHAATRHLGAEFEIADDIYQYKNIDVAGVHLLLSLDRGSLDLSSAKMNREDTILPVAWTRNFGRGRVFYTALGDWEPTWSDPRYRTHLTEGIKWAIASEKRQ